MHLKLITIFIFFASSISINPGLTIKLDLKNIDIVKAKFIPIINKTIEDMTIVENMRIGGFNIKQTNVKIYPIKPEQIIVGMGQGDILFLSIKNLYVKTVSNTALDMLLFDWDGKISTSGYINRVRCIVKFKKFNEKEIISYTTKQGLAGELTLFITGDSKDNLWIGTYGNGVSKYDGKSFTNYDTLQGLPRSRTSRPSSWMAKSNSLHGSETKSSCCEWRTSI